MIALGACAYRHPLVGIYPTDELCNECLSELLASNSLTASNTATAALSRFVAVGNSGRIWYSDDNGTRMFIISTGVVFDLLTGIASGLVN